MPRPRELPAARRLEARSSAFRRALLDWYDRSARDLPWRVRPTLYKTVVSEFMLQQTQVRTALPYFEKWMRRFPDFAALADAPEATVLKAWQGLGYYARARNLRKLAQRLAASPEPPRRLDEWLALPGIGPYTAAAVCSISFGVREPCVDGNVVRLLARLVGDSTAYTSGSQAAVAYRELAARLISPSRPGDYNQAAMELGATVCRKADPQCSICPARRFCQASADGDPGALPRFANRRYVEKTVDRAWAFSKGKLLLRRPDPDGPRLGGLFELPALAEVGVARPPRKRPLFVGRRSITKYRITERLHDLSDRLEPLESEGPLLWASPEELEALPLSGPHARWIRQLLRSSEASG